MTVPHNSDEWRKSSRSQNEGACVELHPAGAVRDSKNPAGPVLALPWTSFVSAVKAGHLTR